MISFQNTLGILGRRSHRSRPPTEPGGRCHPRRLPPSSHSPQPLKTRKGFLQRTPRKPSEIPRLGHSGPAVPGHQNPGLWRALCSPEPFSAALRRARPSGAGGGEGQRGSGGGEAAAPSLTAGTRRRLAGRKLQRKRQLRQTNLGMLER